MTGWLSPAGEERAADKRRPAYSDIWSCHDQQTRFNFGSLYAVLPTR